MQASGGRTIDQGWRQDAYQAIALPDLSRHPRPHRPGKIGSVLVSRGFDELHLRHNPPFAKETDAVDPIGLNLSLVRFCDHRHV